MWPFPIPSDTSPRQADEGVNGRREEDVICLAAQIVHCALAPLQSCTDLDIKKKGFKLHNKLIFFGLNFLRV